MWHQFIIGLYETEKKIGIGMVDEIYELGTPEYLEKYLNG